MANNNQHVKSTPNHQRGYRDNTGSSYYGDILSTNYGTVPCSVGTRLTSDAVEKFMMNEILAPKGITDAESFQVVMTYDRGLKLNTLQSLLIFSANSPNVNRNRVDDDDDLIDIVQFTGGKIRFSEKLRNAVGPIMPRNAAPQIVDVKEGNGKRKLCFIPIDIDLVVSMMLNIDGLNYELAFSKVESKKIDKDRQLITFIATKYESNKRGKKKKSSGSKEMQDAINQYLNRSRRR